MPEEELDLELPGVVIEHCKIVQQDDVVLALDLLQPYDSVDALCQERPHFKSRCSQLARLEQRQCKMHRLGIAATQARRREPGEQKHRLQDELDFLAAWIQRSEREKIEDLLASFCPAKREFKNGFKDLRHVDTVLVWHDAPALLEFGISSMRKALQDLSQLLGPVIFPNAISIFL